MIKLVVLMKDGSRVEGAHMNLDDAEKAQSGIQKHLELIGCSGWMTVNGLTVNMSHYAAMWWEVVG